MSAVPIASLSLEGWSQDAPGWWRNGVVNLSARPVCAPVGSQLLLGSNPEVGEKLPPDTAGWFLLEVTR
jgi:hypothetical protein